MIGENPGGTVERIIGELGVALIRVGEENALAVGGPAGTAGVAVEFGSDGVRVAAVAVGEIQVGGLVALVAVVEAGVGDELAVGGNVRGLIGTVAMSELREGAVGDAEFEDLGGERLVLVIRSAVHGNDERLSVGGPGGVRTAKIAGAGTVGKLSGGELTRRAAVGGHDENLRIAGLEVAGAVESVDEVLIDLGRIRPLGALGRGGKRGDLRRSGGDQRGKGNLLSIGRPG